MKIRVGIMTADHIEYERYDNGTFLLKNVRIGIDFHWDRREDQLFEGELEIMRNADGTETAVNIIDIEDYLTSVISSEMAASSPIELLKAHAVISRGWLIRLIERERNRKATAGTMRQAAFEDGGHVGFDVCADDHCQRYEGLYRRNERAIEAVNATRGQVLTFQGEICDTRFSKCCGGRSEEFETCWDDMHYPYLESVECPYCGRAAEALKESLNSYDQETTDFHDWTVTYTQEELSSIIREKSGIDFGDILALTPLKRGKSGRIYALEIKGTKHCQVIGKELTIRKWLSPKCLYSSWFDVEITKNADQDTPAGFILHGHGWGHGVGLCQIGAAEMAHEGFDYTAILEHYFPNSILKNKFV